MLGRLFGKDAPKRSGGQLAARLEAYPPWHVPHLGTTGTYPGSTAPKLSRGELRDNLHAYVAAMPARLETVGGLLGEFGLAAGEAYDESTRVGFFQQLHVWLLAELPPTWSAELADFRAWEASDRSGPRIVHSLLGDLAMLFADVLLKAKPGCFVGMDLDPGDRTMVSYGRPCLIGLSDSLFPGTHRLYDFEDELFGVYRRMKEPATSFARPETVMQGPSGRMIGFPLIEACERYVVEHDLAGRRAQTWMKDAV